MVAVYLQFFRHIALSFATHASNHVIEAQVADIIARLPRPKSSCHTTKRAVAGGAPEVVGDAALAGAGVGGDEPLVVVGGAAGGLVVGDEPLAAVGDAALVGAGVGDLGELATPEFTSDFVTFRC